MRRVPEFKGRRVEVLHESVQSEDAGKELRWHTDALVEGALELSLREAYVCREMRRTELPP